MQNISNAIKRNPTHISKEKQDLGGSTFCGERMRKKKILKNYGIMNSLCRNYVHKNSFFLRNYSYQMLKVLNA